MFTDTRKTVKKTKKKKEKKKYGTNITIDKITHATARWLEKN
jgi:hypothetical protein